MDIFFADDSVQTGPRVGMGRLVAVGGVFLESNQLRSVAANVDSVASGAGVPQGTEIKWSPPPENWLHQNLHDTARTDLFVKILEVVKHAGGRVCVIVWDTGRTSLKGQEAFDKAMDYLFERLSVHAAKRNSYFTIVADRPGGGKKQEDDFLEEFVRRTEVGTAYVPPDRCLLNVLTTPSRLLRHLQVADLIVGATTSMVAGKYRYARPVFEHIKPILFRNVLEYAGGTGLKLFPDELANLYHWVLGEAAFTKAATGLGRKLPAPGYPYEIDDGKS